MNTDQSILVNHLMNYQTGPIKQESNRTMSWSHEVSATPSTDHSVHSQNMNVRKEGSSLSSKGVSSSLQCQVKTEPACEGELDYYEQKNSTIGSLFVKQETQENKEDNCSLTQGESPNQMKSSEYEDSGEETNAAEKSDDYILPHNVTDTDISEDDSMSDTIGDIKNQRQIDNKKLIFQENIERLCHANTKTGRLCSQCVFNRNQTCLSNLGHIHTGENPNTCELCGKVFKPICDMTSSHSNERTYSCNLCNMTFTHKDHLQDHKASYHSNERPYCCDLCGKTFTRKDKLQNHKAARHSNERPHPCDMCGKAFKLKDNLQKHKAACHSNERPYACDLCEKTFKLKAHLRDHKTACHSNERPYSCDLCKKTFKLKTILQKHKRESHSNERPHSCDQCEKTFKLRVQLRNHKAACHSNERPYPCDLCEKTYKRKADLRKHQDKFH